MRKQRSCLTIFLAVMGVLVVLCLAAVGAAWFDNRSLPTRSSMIDHLSEQDKAHLAEVMRIRGTLGDQILPGWSQADIPLILFNEEYVFLVGYADPPDGWVKVPQNRQTGGAWEEVPGDLFDGQPYYRMRQPGPGVTPQNFTVRVGDRWAASLMTYEWMQISMADIWREQVPEFLHPIFPFRLITNLFVGSSEVHVAATLHEAAHAYQGVAARERLESGEQANLDWQDRYPWEDEALQSEWQRELDLLHAALKTDDLEETRSLAAQFLAQRDSRREKAGLGPDLVNFERNREWVEGIGKYAERMSYQLAAEAGSDKAVPAIQEDPQFSGYRDSARRWSNEVDQMRRMASSEGDGRFYYSGWAQAVLLDRLSPGWQSQLFEDQVWLENLLREAVN